MKKYLPFIIGGFIIAALIIGFLVYFLAIRDNSNKSQNGIKKSISLDINSPMCNQIPESVVESAINRDVIKTQDTNYSNISVCKYYLDQTNFVTLRLNALNYENQKKGQQTLGRVVSTDPNINIEHFIATQENGKINDVILKLGDNLFLAVDRSNGTVINNEILIKLAVSVANYIKSGVNVNKETSTATTNNTNNNVSTQNDEGFIRSFFKSIEDGKAADAVMVMSNKNTSDDSVKQAWGVQFNNMNSVKIISLSPSQQNSWDDTHRQYKVVLDIVMNPNSANAPIPYYGYENGQNTRWINLLKEDGAWRVDSIATGP